MINEKKKSKIQFPNVYILLIILAIIAAVLTWLVPAGAFETTQEANITRVVPGTFHLVEQNPQNLWDVFMAIVIGFQKSSSLIFLVLFIGAALYMLQETKTIEASFRIFTKVKGKEWLTILLIMGIMSIGGATGILGNATLALIPIGIMISGPLGFDKTTGFAMMFFGAFSGFSVGWTNFSTVGIAHTIAELPMFSGMGIRVIIHIINFLLSYGFVLYYVKSIQKDPYKSLNYEEGMKIEDFMGSASTTEDDYIEMTFKHKLCLVFTVVSFAVVILGAIYLKWGPSQYTAIFIILAFAIGIVNGYGLNETADKFITGCGTMVKAAFIIGFARAITILMDDGNILNTIVHYMASPIDKMGPVLGANFMVVANIIINFFISSGSGQAAAVMPIMIPLADLTGITRQVATQAFQFGDGFTNIIIPTVGTLMGGLGFANLKYNKYLKWVMPLLIVQTLLSFLAITILQLVQWGPM